MPPDSGGITYKFAWLEDAMKKIVIGILAHVDAGKTSLSEAILYNANVINQLGRVDSKNTTFDCNEYERARGITIFSKEAFFNVLDTQITLIDTPGHVDFSKEMERSLSVLDAAILVISGMKGVESHTVTVFRALRAMKIPTFVFFNKMDATEKTREELMANVREKLDSEVTFVDRAAPDFLDEFGLSSDDAMEAVLEGRVSDELITSEIVNNFTVFCFYGSATKNEGVKELVDFVACHTPRKVVEGDKNAYVYKISRGEGGERISHVKILNGSYSVREMVGEEKITQIRKYCGEKYESVGEAEAGDVVCFLGLNETFAGSVIGDGESLFKSFSAPVLKYKIFCTDGTDNIELYSKLKLIEEEEPALNLSFDEKKKEILIEVVGPVYMEVLTKLLKDRYGLSVSFGQRSIIYRESIEGRSVGIGHFEPLRHYAHVEVIVSGGEIGSGIKIKNECSEDVLPKNYIATVLNDLQRKRHRGVLTGSRLTDVEITLVSGRAHNKHTSGGDFYEASQRAVRCALMYANNYLQEPYYEFLLELPLEYVGRAMTDFENMNAKYEISQQFENVTIIKGVAPVALMCDYQEQIMAYSKGLGRLYLSGIVYDKCHNEAEVIKDYDYIPTFDVSNSPNSVICEGGASKILSYQDVFLRYPVSTEEKVVSTSKIVRSSFENSIGTEEIDSILEKTYNANKGKENKKTIPKKTIYSEREANYKGDKKTYKNKYLVVDGYNVIHAFAELKDIMSVSMDGARDRLIDILENYKGTTGYEVLVVFDAYRVARNESKYDTPNGVTVLFTREAQTADQYIERFCQKHAKDYNIFVVTSDGLEQIIVRGAGANIISSREFERIIYAK